MSGAAAQRSESRRTPVVSPPVSGAVGLVDEDRRILADAERALSERPNISMTLRIGLSMLLCFLLVVGVVLASLVTISHVGKQQELLDKVSTYALEVEQARRYEKNFLLYGTGLDEALTQVQAAHQQLLGAKDNIVEQAGPNVFDRMQDNLEQYGHLLEQMGTLSREPQAERQEERTGVERELRRHGAQLIADATDLIERERLRLHTAIHTSWMMAGASLLFIMLTMVAVAYVQTRQVGDPLMRFVGYTERIADGDFSPILPTRRYRDEFSRLAVAINRMVFRLKDREVQLARTSRMAAVGTLTAGIAHELNNPLNNIGLTAEALHDGLTTYSDQQKTKMLGDILSQVQRASATVRNLLDFTRVETPVLSTLSIEDVVRETRRLVANEAKLGGVDLSLQLPGDLPKIRGNARELQQVFLNLFLNAIQAMPNGGLLTVQSKTTGDGFLEVDVTDTGVGIPEENIGSVFDPFFTTKEVGAGTGLGLFVSYGIVEQHHGSLTLRSKVGEGTTFVVRLPVIAASRSGQPAIPSAREEG
jgi:two-component system, NtrC family, sensor kinase